MTIMSKKSYFILNQSALKTVLILRESTEQQKKKNYHKKMNKKDEWIPSSVDF